MIQKYRTFSIMQHLQIKVDEWEMKSDRCFSCIEGAKTFVITTQHKMIICDTQL